MFKAGSVLHGIFKLKNTTKPKFAIVLHNDGENCITTTFTTSQERSGVLNPIHGKNPSKGEPLSYVFKEGVEIGEIKEKGIKFAFKKDTVIVPDYGIHISSIKSFLASGTEIEKQCDLYEQEYINLVYTLYKCRKTRKNIQRILEKILQQIVK